MTKPVLFFLLAAASAFFPALGQSTLNPSPTRVLGQPQVLIKSAAPNLVEGRELYSPQAVAVDRSTTSGPLYVADTRNNRVLAWRNSGTFANGAAADLVIGQVDMSTTQAQGPGIGRSTGLNLPSAVTVDAQGNLYVVDAGNNRVLRFPRPFTSTEEIQTPDMVIGQRNFTSGAPNHGEREFSATGIATASGGTVERAGLLFDTEGNLWFADSLNHRVLRFPAAALAAGGNGPAANLVLGQIGFNIVEPATADSRGLIDKSHLRSPSGMAFDPGGRLFVADGLGRVLVYVSPFFSGQAAARIMGIYVSPQGQTPPRTNEYLLGSPEGVVVVGNNPIVVDTGFNRLLRFDRFEDWPVESTAPGGQFSPPARGVIGQESFTDNRPNRGRAEAGPDTLALPGSAVFVNNELYVADSGNNRVIVFPNANPGVSATRVLGQANFNFIAPNRVEGRELFLFSGFSAFGNLGGSFADGGGIAIDRRADTPRLYIADTYNNRILGYRDARRVRTGDSADIVIGQADFQRTLINAPQNDPNVPNDGGLFRPTGLAVDDRGNLWVADTGNARVLRFPNPFGNFMVGQRSRADLVLGQSSFGAKVQDPSSRNMSAPFGLAFTVEGHLLVSDAGHHRALLFRRPGGGDFTSGQAASRVFGQPDFLTGTRTQGDRRLFSPRHISVDSDDRLYLTDTGNNRVVIYDRVVDPAGTNDPAPAVVIPNLTAQAIYVNPVTGEVWIADPHADRALRYPRFERLAVRAEPEFAVSSANPLAIAQDSAGNLYIAEAVNRASIYFNALTTSNAANYNDRPLAPGLIATIFPRGDNVLFSDQTVVASQVPLPTTLGDTQVLIDDKPVPLYFVSPRQINFYVPMATPTSGRAEFQVIRASSGQILAAGDVELAAVSPGLFVRGGSDSGQVAALNEDNSVNDPTNPISRGRVIQLFGTGQGFIPNAPPDGSAPAGPVETPVKPDVLVGTAFVDPANVLYSGLAPGLVGVWQINVRIPDTVAPDNRVPVVVRLQSVLSNRGRGNIVLNTTIAVRQ